MDIPDNTFTRVQEVIDSGEIPAGIFVEPSPIYRASIDDLLSQPTPLHLDGNYRPPRPFTDWERENLTRSLPILGFSWHRMVTQGPDALRIYSFGSQRTLVPSRISAGGIPDTMVYHPSVRTGVRIQPRQVLAGQWAFGLNPAGEHSRSPEQVLEEMDQIAGGRERWKDLSVSGAPSYAITDQARVYRIRPYPNGRSSNSRTGAGIPYELSPFMVNGHPQVTLSEAITDASSPITIRAYVRTLYRAIWGEEVTPLIAARYYGTEVFNPNFDTVAMFNQRKRGRPSAAQRAASNANVESSGSEEPAESWGEESSVSL